MSRFQLMQRLCSVGSVFLLLAVTGCGSRGATPELGKVNGVVSLDGAPVANAQVTFTPSAGGRGSTAITNEQGAYDLLYVFNQHGAVLGEHQICVNSQQHAGEGAADPVVPAKYNAKSQLKATVKPGANLIDLALTKAGEIPAIQK